jgi:hypothetical protein
MPSLISEIKQNHQNSQKSRRWPLIIAGSAFLVLLLVLGGLYFRAQSKLKQTQKALEQQQNDPAAQLKKDNQELITKVGKLIILPIDEDPTVATVSDLNKLQGQPFFAKAQLGDKVLIYTKAKKAILYRPSSNQIIELAPLLDSAQPAAPTTSSTTPAQ